MSTDKVKDTIEKLNEINKIIVQFDPSIRGHAFEILKPLFFEKAVHGGKVEEGENKPPAPPPTADKEEFFSSFEHSKPDENVILIVAWLYSQYGVFPITRNFMEEEAQEVGLTIPTRSDNTMRQKRHKNKSLFHKKGGGWQLTVPGEMYLKETYNVKKGNKPLPEEPE